MSKLGRAKGGLVYLQKEGRLPRSLSPVLSYALKSSHLRRLHGFLRGFLGIQPDFIVIGAQRSGTTSLFAYLAQHPSILPARRKEVHFFDFNYEKGIWWYRSQFPLFSKKYQTLLKYQGPCIAGEASPYYIYHPLVPFRTFHALPRVKLIAILRNPVERAFSHYNHSVKIGAENLSFEDAIDKEEERIRKEVGQRKYEPRYSSWKIANYSYLSRGIYYDQLVRWAKHFPRSQMLVIKSENLFEHPAQTYETVLRFLGAHPFKLRQYERFLVGRYSPINPPTRNRLIRFFEPHNEQLYKFLGTNLHWE